MEIIGQKKLLSIIDKRINNNKLARFIIIDGVHGSGKKLISSYIADRLGATFIPCELGIDNVREIIALSYTLTEPTVYMWADADKMSIGAKNAVLKVTEEPPQNAYFIMTTSNLTNILPTLTSRGTLFTMNPYTPTEIETIIKKFHPDAKLKVTRLIMNLATTPQDVMDLFNTDVDKLSNTIDVFCTNVGNINLANSLKISTFLQFKEEDADKFNPVLFMRGCMFEFSKLFIDTFDTVYSKLVKITSKYLADMESKSLSKVATVDNWILELHYAVVGE